MPKKSAKIYTGCRVSHGLLNRWTSQYDWGNTTGWLERIVNILQITHHIFIKVSVCTSMRVILFTLVKSPRIYTGQYTF